MKILLLIIMTVCCCMTYAQTGQEKLSTEPCVFVKEGVQFFPPAHFTCSEKVNGCIHPGSGASITVSFINRKYPVVMKGLSETSFAANHLILLSQEATRLPSGLNVTVFCTSETIASNDSTRQEKEFRRILLFAEMPSGTVCLQAAYPADMHPLLYEVLTQSIHSLKLYANKQN